MPQARCTVQGCKGLHYGQGYCSKHYKRFKAHGNPHVVLPRGPGQRPTCSLLSCNRPHYAHGYCQSHYRRWRLYGDPNVARQVQYKGLNPRQYFFMRITKTDGCWHWRGPQDRDGYGVFRLQGKTYRATHVSWEIAYGHCPIGAHVLHHCDNPSCVNPEHLFLGTMADNMKDMWLKGRGRYEIPTERAHGVNNAHAKLTDDLVLEIRQSSMSTREWANALGMAWQVVHSARVGRTWKHVDMPPHSATERYVGETGGSGWRKGKQHTEATRAKMIQAAHRGVDNAMSKPITIAGVSYASLADAASALGLTRRQLGYRLKTGLIPVEQEVSHGIDQDKSQDRP